MGRNQLRRRSSWGSTSFTLKGSFFTRKGLALLLWIGLNASQVVWSAEDTSIVNESTYKVKLAEGQEQIVYRGSPLFYQDKGVWKRIDPNWKISGEASDE